MSLEQGNSVSQKSEESSGRARVVFRGLGGGWGGGGGP